MVKRLADPEEAPASHHGEPADDEDHAEEQQHAADPEGADLCRPGAFQIVAEVIEREDDREHRG